MAGERYAGLVLTSPRRYYRCGRSYPADLVIVLGALLADPPGPEGDWVHWLP